MHARLAETMSFVEEKRRELLDSVKGVPGETLCRKSTPDTWSVAEILDHLKMVESGVARLITKRVGQAKESGASEETSTSSVFQSFDPFARKLDSSILQSPQGVKPRENIDISEALDGLASSREALRAAVLSADGVALGEIKHTHPILGELDLYQWLIFLGHHEGRHRKQIDRTLKSIPQ
ncbi:MAG TPA: DinB family protein [Gemmatimonadaceae bacterium]|jgi:hypothetical protein